MELMPGIFSPLADALCAAGNGLPLSQGGAAGGAARLRSGGAPAAPQPAHDGPLTADQQPPSEHQDAMSLQLLYVAPCGGVSKHGLWQDQSVWASIACGRISQRGQLQRIQG